MLQRLARPILAALLIAAGAPLALAQAPQPVGLLAEHRSGQTFVTWTEEATAESYRVYRHDQPIDAVSLSEATLLREVWNGSGEFYSDRYYIGGTMTWQKRYHTRFVIEDESAELPAGTGLLVWTVAEEDFDGGASGDAYYAVTSVDAGGVENVADFTVDNSVGPVAEQIDLPAPVLSKRILNGVAEIYIQYLDLRNFNPTLSAPNAYNEYYGLSDSDPKVAQSIQYAFTYALFPPKPGCEEVGGEAPIVLRLHGWGGQGVRPWNHDPDPNWCQAYRLYPIDVSNTWWFGNARDHDYRTGLVPPSSDVVVNFTEQRLLRMIRDLTRDETHGPLVDPERVYVYGHSMGGSGTLAMALRFPNVFAGAHASQPMTNYLTDGDGGGTDWRPDVEVKLGAVADALPVEIGAPEGLADDLVQYSGTPVWDWQNHQANLADRRADDMVPIGIDHGIQDLVIEWSTQGAPVYGAFEDSDRCWAGATMNALHVSSELELLPTAMAPGAEDIPWAHWQVVLSETVPGISGDIASPPFPPVSATNYNDRIDWSSSWDAWDGAPIDEPDQWRMTLRSLPTVSSRVDVTPRRLQQFTPTLGWAYRWSNTRVDNGTTVATGTIRPDADSLLRVVGVEVRDTGSRLSIAPTLSASTDTLSLAAGGTQELQLDFGADVGNLLYLVVGSAAGTTPGFFVGGNLVSVAFDPYLLHTLSKPNSTTLKQSLGTLDASGDAVCTLTVPAATDPALAGVVLNHVAVVLEVPGIGTLLYASNPIPVELVP